MNEEPPARPVAADGVVHHAFSLLRALSESTEPLGVTQLAQRTGLAKSTAQRLLGQLAAEGAVERQESRWVLGRAPYGSPKAAEVPPGLAALVRPRLGALALSTGASLFVSATGPDRRIRIIGSSHGARMSGHISGSASDAALGHPDSVVRKALAAGQPVTEHGEVHREFSCVGTVLALPSGGQAVLSLALPRNREMERFKRPLERHAAVIADEARAMAVLRGGE